MSEFPDFDICQLAAKVCGFDGDSMVDGAYRWNPLKSDSDALVCAVKLEMHMGLECNCSNVWMGGMHHWTSVQHKGDPMGATRRAISECAAKFAIHSGYKA